MRISPQTVKPQTAALVALVAVAAFVFLACDPAFKVRIENDLERSVMVAEQGTGASTIEPGRSRTIGKDEIAVRAEFHVTDEESGELIGCLVVDFTGRDIDEVVQLRTSEAEPCPVTQQQVPLHLYVSNQSFESRRVDITVWIDGHEVVDQEFDVKDQHNWIVFDVHLGKGVHHLRAEAPDEGGVFEVDFELEAETWAVLEFWRDEEPSRFTWRDSDRGVGFD